MTKYIYKNDPCKFYLEKKELQIKSCLNKETEIWLNPTT